MSSLRALGFCYLATASAFVLALAYSDHAALKAVAGNAAQTLERQLREQLIKPAIAFALAEDEKVFDSRVRMRLRAPGPDDARDLAHATLPVIPARPVQAQPVLLQPVAPEYAGQPALTEGAPYLPAPDIAAGPANRQTAPAALPPIPPRKIAPARLAQVQPIIMAPDLPPMAVPPSQHNAARTPPPSGEDAEKGALTAQQRAQVTARLAAALSPELRRNFGLFLYVSKAASGPLAQRLYVFRKTGSGNLDMLYDWAASTGRERYEISPLGRQTRTDTPRGYFELDPHRMYRRYHSHAWNQPMPYAMFFNWEHHGLQTGLAVHAATGADIAKLGSRASAGCVHISPAHAARLYKLIRQDYKGKVPRFAFDKRTQTMSKSGDLMRDRHGKLVMADGYRVLVLIQDFGGTDVMAALY